MTGPSNVNSDVEGCSTGSRLVHSWHDPSLGPRLGLLVKASYRIEPGRRASRLAESPAWRDAPVYAAPTSEGERALVHESDLLAFRRPLTDVLLTGSARSRRGSVVELITGLRIGPVHKRVRVRGDRRLRVGGGGVLGATAPEGFVSLPLEWAHAYGGRDAQAERRLRRDPTAPPEARIGTLAYPRNRVGRGFFIDENRERLEGALLPNLDDPDDAVEPDRLLAADALDWADRPVAAAYGPIDALTVPRCFFHLLRPDWRGGGRPLRELALGALGGPDLRDRDWTEPPDARLFCCASSGLAQARLRGDERVALWHLHERFELLEVDLPAEQPRLFLEPPNVSPREAEPLLQCVLIEPDEDQITLTWTGSIPVAVAFPEPACREVRHRVLWQR